MKSCRYKSGFTLVETLVVIAIIVILAAMVVGITSRVNNQTKERLTERTFAILDVALQEFRDYGWNYNSPVYVEFKFPLDVTEPVVPPVPPDILQIILGTEYAPAKVTIEPLAPTMPIVHIPEYASSELLYFFLSKVPECRAALEKIDKSLITRVDFQYGNEMKLVIDGTEYPLFRFVDPWRQGGTTARIGQTLLYDYSYEYQPPSGPPTFVKRNFPVITSAGPDGIFGTSDDISSR